MEGGHPAPLRSASPDAPSITADEGADMSQATDARSATSGPKAKTGPVLSADGSPLKRSLSRALRMQKMRALALIAPLLLFVLVTFIAPIADMLFRSVENEIVSATLPETVERLAGWDPDASDSPDEAVFSALYADLYIAAEQKIHTRLGSRLNYERSGLSSLFRKSGREVGRFDTDPYLRALTAADPALKTGEGWIALFSDDRARAALPFTARTWDRWADVLLADKKDPAKRKTEEFLFVILQGELHALAPGSAAPAALVAAAAELEPMSLKTSFIEADEDWGSFQTWRTIQIYSPHYTSGYFLNAIDMEKGFDGPQARPENQQIYITLFQRTLFMSIVITVSCILLGYPVAWLLANVRTRTANLLMILVLLPFWTSLLVRTASWKILLQQQGVINDLLVWSGLISDEGRLETPFI